MAGHLEALKELARGYLPPDEALRAAADVVYGGKVNSNQSAAGMAALGHHEAQTAAGEALANRIGDAPIVAFPSAAQMAIVLTDHRLVIWSRGGFKGKPKAFIGEVPLEAIGAVGVEPRPKGDRLSISMRSGWEITLDVEGDRADEHFGTTLAAAVGETAAPDLVEGLPATEEMPAIAPSEEDDLGVIDDPAPVEPSAPVDPL